VRCVRNLPYSPNASTPCRTDRFDVIMGQIPQLSSVKAGAISFHKFDLDFAVNITRITQNFVDLTNKIMLLI
jgi:hypothetical protein